MGAERRRLAEADSGERGWRSWGPYLSERAWATVREDYSEYGSVWDHFPHDLARSRVYRWNEDGMAGICDDRQNFCFGLALWNGKDAIIKERMFGLGGDAGNHGEDAKDYWWYLDSTPTHSWMKWRYHYPQRRFPYDELVAENDRRGRLDPEYELVDTGIFDEDRYWVVEVDYAKGGPSDMCIKVTIRNKGPEPATLSVLPQLWFRNTWAWGLPGRDYRPEIRPKDNGLLAEHRLLGRLALTGDGSPQALFCDNETNGPRVLGKPGGSRYPKDGINDFIVHGLRTVKPDEIGTKAALHYLLAVPAGGKTEIRLRLNLHAPGAKDLAPADQLRGAVDAEHFAYIADAAYEFGLWDEEEAFFYDVLRTHDGERIPLKVRSVVGLLPLTATTIITSSTLRRLPDVAARLRWFLTNKPEYGDVVGAKKSRGGQQLRLLSMVGPDQLIRILQRMLDEEEFLSPYGLRTLSRAHKDEPFTVHIGEADYTVGYEPAESTSGLFGGNSNWRGPIWFPVNYILIEAVRRFS